jgi:hypothetical protein
VGSLGADFDASPLRLAANDSEPTLKAELNRLFSFRLRTAPARFGAWDGQALGRIATLAGQVLITCGNPAVVVL